MTTTTTARPVTERDRAYFNIFVTALEGGIGYWSSCMKYRWSKDDEEDVLGFYAELYDVETPAADLPDRTFVLRTHKLQDGVEYALLKIDREVIAKGVGRFIAWAKEGSPSEYFKRAAVALDWGKWDDLDVDAEIADYIVQLGLYGKAVYG